MTQRLNSFHCCEFIKTKYTVHLNRNYRFQCSLPQKCANRFALKLWRCLLQIKWPRHIKCVVEKWIPLCIVWTLQMQYLYYLRFDYSFSLSMLSSLFVLIFYVPVYLFVCKCSCKFSPTLTISNLWNMSR